VVEELSQAKMRDVYCTSVCVCDYVVPLLFSETPASLFILLMIRYHLEWHQRDHFPREAREGGEEPKWREQEGRECKSGRGRESGKRERGTEIDRTGGRGESAREGE
jgi:hypothetical protein